MKDSLIVLPADYVGYKIVEYLISIKEPISFLVLDEGDRGGFNSKIISCYHSVYKDNPIYYSKRLNDDEFLEMIEKSKLGLGILAYWPHIIKGRILKIPKNGWLNHHPSYLPYNRGKHASFWALVDETEFGATLQFINEGVDTGDYILRKKIPYNWKDTGETLHKKAMDALIDLFKENFYDIKQNRLPKIKQDLEKGTYHHSTDITQIVEIKLDKQYTARKY